MAFFKSYGKILYKILYIKNIYIKVSSTPVGFEPGGGKILW